MHAKRGELLDGDARERDVGSERTRGENEVRGEIKKKNESRSIHRT